MLETNKNAVTVIYSGGDVQVPFVFYDADDLVVLVETTMKTMGTDYTVTGAGNTAGGKVSFVNAPADGTRVTVIRKIDFTQLLSIPQNGIIPEGALSKALDRIVMMIQQLEERADRAVEYPEGTDKNDVANAQNILDSIEEGTQTITNAVQVAEATLQASNIALAASNKALNDAETKRMKVNQDGDTQVERILTEGNKQDSRIEAEGSKQVNLVKTEGEEKSAYVRNIGDWHFDRLVQTGSEQYSRVHNEGEIQKAAVIHAGNQNVNRVNSVGAAIVDIVEALPNYTKDIDAIVNKYKAKAISSALAGTAGKWKFVTDFTQTVSSIAGFPNWGVSTKALKGLNSLTEDYGLGYAISEKFYGVVFGDSGTPYEVVRITASSSFEGTYIHPKHGDISSDFTVGQTYKGLVFVESSDQLDQEIGVKSVEEYNIGQKWVGTINYPVNSVEPTGNPLSINENYWIHLLTTTTITASDDSLSVRRSVNTDKVAKFVFTRNDNVAPSIPVKGGDTLNILGTSSEKLDLRFIEYLSDGSNRVSDLSKQSLPVRYKVPDDIAYISAIYFDTSVTSSRTVRLYNLRITKTTSDSVSDVLPVGSYGTLNIGYWDGKDWKPQILGDAEYIDNGSEQYIRLRLSDKWTSGDAVQVLNKTGSWVAATLGDHTTQGGARFVDSLNAVNVNVGQSFAHYGYASIKEMIAESAVHSSYKSKTRVMRPIANPSKVMLESDWVVVPQHSDLTIGDALVGDLIGHVMTITSGHPLNMAIMDKVFDYKAGELIRNSYTAKESAYGDSTDKNRAAIKFGLANINGKMHLVAWFKELIHESNWGDSGTLVAADNLTTTTDDNGNVVLTGCMGFDTGLSA